MTAEKKNPDIVLRLPDEKKPLKTQLVKIAKRNRMTLTDLMIFMMESFLEDHKKGREFVIKIR